MFVFRKKALIATAIFLGVLLAFSVCIAALLKAPVQSADKRVLTVVIDAGHGGIDAGVTGSTGVKESDLNLEIAKVLATQFENAGIKAVLTRQTQGGLYGLATKGFKKRDMKKRKQIIEETAPNLVISIHLNKYSHSERRGAQTFYNPENLQGKQLAESVQNALNDMEGAVRTCQSLAGDYYLLNCTPYPATIVECGFLSSPEDEKLLITPEYREKISYAVFKGAVDYLSTTQDAGAFER